MSASAKNHLLPREPGVPSLPSAFIDRMQEQLGPEFDAFMETYQKEDHLHGLRLNPQALPAGPAQDLLSRVIGDLSDPIPWAGDAYYYIGDRRPGKHPYHEAGLYYIQEPSAMAPATYLDVLPGDYVLDLCAAPGGKSAQIAAALEGRGLLVSNEIVPNRALVLSENIERLGPANILVTNEDPDRLAGHFPRFFAKIMVDAPCSGEGMFRKNPIARSEWSPQNVQACADRDDRILDAADRMLAEGGRLVFSTCTFAPAEDEGSIRRFLSRHPGYRIEPAALCSGMTPSPLEGTIRLWPHKLRGEGHYIAVLRKETGAEGRPSLSDRPEEKLLRAGSSNAAPGLKDRDLPLLADFLRETVTPETVDRLLHEGILLRFKDDYYRIPRGLPSLKGLRLTRAGLHLGAIRKNRFEPSHALAHALIPRQLLRTLSLPAMGTASDHSVFTAERWIRGETFRAEGAKGWYLVTVDGVHLGWGKLAGGSMKNHYPKGLRRIL